MGAQLAESEFVYLSSDADVEGYNRRNTASDYIVPLARSLRVTPDWEVGLMEIIIPGCTYNVMKPWDRAITIGFERKTYDREGHGFTKRGKLFIRVREGQYSPLEFAEYVNSVLEKLQVPGPGKQTAPFKLFHGRLKYEANTRRMAFHLRLGESIAVTHPVLRRMLGFTALDPLKFRHRRKKSLSPIAGGGGGGDDDENVEQGYEVSEISDWKRTTPRAGQVAAAAGGTAEEEEDEMTDAAPEALEEATHPQRKRRNDGRRSSRHTYSATAVGEVSTEGSVRDAVAAITTLHGGSAKMRRYHVFRPSDVCDFDINGQHMYVYADIAEYSRVGDTEAPLLRVVPLGSILDGKVCTSEHVEFKNVHYRKLRGTHFDTIHIKLCNAYGEDMPFVRGDSLVVLHFRKTEGKD